MKKFELLAATTLAMVLAQPAFAQDAAPASQAATTDQAADTDPNFGEVVVTAAKREQTLQDVPISVSVTSADTLEKAQIVDLKDLQSVVPSLKVTQFQSAGQTNFTIRGFGNGNGNIGIESSVGVFIDGVYRSRSASALADLPDVERIEVLRGPQSTLFGKNVSAGAISVVTKRPQFTWGGRAEATAGNYGSIQANASITGPISETVAFRVYGSVNQRDGYFKNIVTGADVNNKDRYSVRGDLLFEPNSDFSIRIIGDYNKINEECCGAATIFNGPATLAIGAPISAGGVGKTIGDPARIFERELVYNTAPHNKLTGKGISGQMDYSTGIGKLTSITAYRRQTNDTTLDVDFTGADISNQTTADKIKTFSQELRLASSGDGPFNYLLGAFYSREKIDSARDIRFGTDARRFINALTGGPQGLVFALESLQNAVTPSIIPGSTYFGAGQGISDKYRMTNTSASIFGQLDYKIGRLTISGGAAYLYDKKKASSDVVLNDRFSLLNLEAVPQLAVIPFASLPTSLSGCLLQKGYNPASRTIPAGFPGAGLPAAPTNLFGASLGGSLPGAGSAPCPASRAGTNPFALNALQFFYGNTTNHAPINFPNANESGILKDDKFVYTGRLAYDVADALNLYATYSTGWKAGAFNLSSDSRPPDPNGIGRTADPESVRVIELGAKAKFQGGYFNLALFDQSIKGFQSNAFTGTGFNLVNAGKQSVKGFEVDAGWRPFRGLQLTGAVTYLDAKYDSFTRATCPSFAPECAPVNGVAPQFRDLSGTTPGGIPKWTTSVSGTYTTDIGSSGWTGFVRGEYDHASKFQVTETIPDTIGRYGIDVVNASIGFSSPDRMDVMFWVRNLTKDNYLLSGFQTVVQNGSYSGYANEPRTYGVTLRKAF